MNNHYEDTEQRKIIEKIKKSIYESCNDYGKLTTKNKIKLNQELLGLEGFRRLINIMRNFY